MDLTIVKGIESSRHQYYDLAVKQFIFMLLHSSSSSRGEASPSFHQPKLEKSCKHRNAGHMLVSKCFNPVLAECLGGLLCLYCLENSLLLKTCL